MLDRGAERLKRAGTGARESLSVRERKELLCGFFGCSCIVAVLPVSGYGALRLYGVVTTTEYLAVEQVTVDGAFRSGVDTVVGLSGIEIGENIFSFRLFEVEQSIKEHPWIESATVSRSIPSTVRIEVAERIPAAIVSADGLYIMDSNGFLFKRHSVSDALDLAGYYRFQPRSHRVQVEP